MKRAVVLIVLLVALGWVAFDSRREAAGDAVQPTTSATAERRKATRDAVPSQVHPIATTSLARPALPARTTTNALARIAPLPSADEPFAQHLDELRRRARGGDAPAACRLGMELYHCAHLDGARAALAAELADAAGDDPAQRGGVESFQKAVQQMEMRCRGVAPLDPLEAFHAQVAAARGGVVQAQLQLAVFPPLDEIDVIDHPEVWREWREAALPALESALAAGDPRAAWKLASAYDRPFSAPFTPRLAPADPFRAYTYRRLVTLIVQRSGASNLQNEASDEEKAGATLTEAQRTAAAAEAQRLFDRYFTALAPNANTSLNGNDFAACEK